MPNRSLERAGVAAAVVTVDAAMLATMGRSVVGLAVALAIAYLLWLRSMTAELPRVVPAYALAIGAQVVHLLEEDRAGFYDKFPLVIGAEAWTRGVFLVFNLAWLLIFVLGAIGLARNWRPAGVVAWFLAIGGGVLNGVAHAGLVVRAGGYFPGAYTAPLVFGAGANLAVRLSRAPRIAPPAVH